MDKQTKFVMLVQTGAIVADLQRERTIAMAVVYEAMRIPVAALSDQLGELSQQAQQYVSYSYGPGGNRPVWLP